ncbi:MAG: SDR family oxidoreductase [Paracoccus sp. (in: a-proteobacteria)]
MHMLVFGHGYTASFLTPRLVDTGWTVTGTTRGNPGRVAATGACPVIWPGDDDVFLHADIARADGVLVSVAPGLKGEAGVDMAADPVLAAFGETLRSARPAWIGYLSSTNVYGDHGGGWVDETTPPRPSTMRAQARLSAECAWICLAGDIGCPLTIFRLAGIYGPGRGPATKLRAGTSRRIVRDNQVFSRIHVEDITGAIMHVLQKNSLNRMDDATYPRIVNLCDDDPLPPERAIEIAAHMLNLPVPPAEPFETAEMTRMARSFYADSKRVRNDLLVRQLGYRLQYPDLRSGLAATITSESQTGQRIPCS